MITDPGDRAMFLLMLRSGRVEEVAHLTLDADKIASSGSSFGPDVSRTGVQRGLLKPMEDTDVDLKVAHDMVSQMEALEDYRRTGKRTKKTINTRNILFILSGAFTGLEEIVKRRLSRTEIGFRPGAAAPAEPPPSWYLRHVAAEDFISYGFESEFIGRIPVTVVFVPLGEEDLYEILRNPNCPVTAGKKADFKAYDIDLFFQDGALRKLATLAHRQRTGARGLARDVEATLLKFEKVINASTTMSLTLCGTGQISRWSGSRWLCSNAEAFAWTPTTNFNKNVNSTSTPIWFRQGLMSSTTAFLSYVSSTSIEPMNGNNTGLLGSFGNAWKNLYVSSTSYLNYVSSTAIDAGLLTMSGNILPNANNTLDLGAFGSAWNNIFASSSAYFSEICWDNGQCQSRPSVLGAGINLYHFNTSTDVVHRSYEACQG